MSNNFIRIFKSIKNTICNIKKEKDFLSIYGIKELELQKILLKKENNFFDDFNFGKIKF